MYRESLQPMIGKPTMLMSLEDILYDEPREQIIRFKLSSANMTVIDCRICEKFSRERWIKDLCIVAPHIHKLDGDLAESYDDAGRTQLDNTNVMAVHIFIKTHQYYFRAVDCTVFYDIRGFIDNKPLPNIEAYREK